VTSSKQPPPRVSPVLQVEGGPKYIWAPQAVFLGACGWPLFDAVPSSTSAVEV